MLDLVAIYARAADQVAPPRRRGGRPPLIAFCWGFKRGPRGDSVFRAALRDDGLRTPTPNKSIR